MCAASARSLVLLNGSNEIGGAERQLQALARELAGRGHDVTLATLFAGRGRMTDRPGLYRRLDLSRASRRGLATVPLIVIAAWRLHRFLRDTSPDVVVSYHWIANVIAWFAVRGLAIPLSWGVRSSDMVLNASRELTFRIGAFLSPTVPLVISNSHSGLRHARRRGYRPKRWAVIPNGIDLERFRFDPEARADLRRQWGVRDDEVLVGTVARIDPMKGYEDLVEAASLLGVAADRVRFACVAPGAESERRRLAQLSRERCGENRFVWVPAVREIERVYSAFDVLCSPSRYGEGWSNVVGEGMACGLPCVVTDVGDSADVIADLGLVVPPASAERLCAAIERMASMYRDIGRDLPRRRVMAEYTTERNVMAMESCLMELAGQTG